jgi:hypothetical protein
MTCEPPIPQRSEPRPDFVRISPTRHETDRTTGLHHAWRRGLGPRLRPRDGASNAKFVRPSPRARPSRRSSARLPALPRIPREPPLTRGRRRRLLDSVKAQLFFGENEEGASDRRSACSKNFAKNPLRQFRGRRQTSLQYRPKDTIDDSFRSHGGFDGSLFRGAEIDG